MQQPSPVEDQVNKTNTNTWEGIFAQGSNFQYFECTIDVDQGNDNISGNGSDILGKYQVEGVVKPDSLTAKFSKKYEKFSFLFTGKLKNENKEIWGLMTGSVDRKTTCFVLWDKRFKPENSESLLRGEFHSALCFEHVKTPLNLTMFYEIVTYTGGIQKGTDEFYSIENVLISDTEECHCSKPGQNFDLVIRRNGYCCPITNIIIRGPMSCTCPVKCGAIFFSDELPNFPSYTSLFDGCENEEIFRNLCSENGIKNAVFFHTDPIVRQCQISLKNYGDLPSRYVHVKFISAHVYEPFGREINIDVDYVGIIGYANKNLLEYEYPEKVPKAMKLLREEVDIRGKLVNVKDCPSHSGYKYRNPNVYVITDNQIHLGIVNNVCESGKYYGEYNFFFASYDYHGAANLLGLELGFPVNSLIIDQESPIRGKTFLCVSNSLWETFVFEEESYTAFNEDAVEQFLMSVKNQNATIVRRSEQPKEKGFDPYTPVGSFLLYLTYNQFESSVLNSDMDVLLCVVTPYIEEKYLHNLYALSLTFRKSGILIFQMKAFVNYLPEEFFPKNSDVYEKGFYQFFKKGDKRNPITFSGDLDDEKGENLIDFVLHNLTIKENEYTNPHDSLAEDEIRIDTNFLTENEEMQKLTSPEIEYFQFLELRKRISTLPNFNPDFIHLNRDFVICYKFDHHQNGSKSKTYLSILTHGLSKHGQKEVMVMFEKDEVLEKMLTQKGKLDPSHEGVRLILTFLQTIHAQAKRGRILTPDDDSIDLMQLFADFASPKKDVKYPFGKLEGLFFTEAKEATYGNIPFPKIMKGANECLYTFFLTRDEIKVAEIHGTTRILNNLGLNERVFPHPLHNRLGRQNSLCVLQQNIMSQVYPLHLHGSFSRVNFKSMVVSLYLSKDHLKKIDKGIQEYLKEQARSNLDSIRFLTGVDFGSEAILCFDMVKGKNFVLRNPLVKEPVEFSMTFVAMCFVETLANQSIRVLQDGCLVLLTKIQFDNALDCIRSGRNVSFDLGSGKFMVKFLEEETDKNVDTNGEVEQVSLLNVKYPGTKVLIERKISNEEMIQEVEQVSQIVKDFFAQNYQSKTDPCAIGEDFSQPESLIMILENYFLCGLAFMLERDTNVIKWSCKLYEDKFDELRLRLDDTLRKSMKKSRFSEKGPDFTIIFTFMVRK